MARVSFSPNNFILVFLWRQKVSLIFLAVICDFCFILTASFTRNMFFFYLFVSHLGRLIKDKTTFLCFLCLTSVSTVVAERQKIKDILRTFYPKYWQILRTSRGKIFFPGPYIKKKCKRHELVRGGHRKSRTKEF